MAEQDPLFPHPGGEQQRLPEAQPGELTPAERLDQPQRFADASSYQVRGDIEEWVRRDLLGPWEGEREELPRNSSGPRDRYLVGGLGPKHVPGSTRAADAGELPDTDSGVSGAGAGGDGEDRELPDVLTPQALGRIWASSMGLSFTVARDVGAVTVTADWGRYTKREVSEEGGDKPRRAWAREPVSHTRTVRLDGDRSQRVPLTEANVDTPGVLLSVEVRPRDDRRIVEVALINAQRQPEHNTDESWLFQTHLAVTADGSTGEGAEAVFQPIDDPYDHTRGPHDDDAEDAHLRLLYRAQRRYASGRNVAVHASVRDGERCAYRLDTTWLPAYDVPETIAPTGPGTPLHDVELSMDALATAEPEALRAGLAPLVDGYTAWLDERAGEVPRLPAGLRSTAESAVYTARQVARRIRAGIDLLATPGAAHHDEALAAFRFTNRAMAAQRRHTGIARLREADGLGFAEARDRVTGQGAAAASWRPFQLAFVLLNLPALTDPANPERAADHDAVVDLLFFPTGGGKTEAYLGLTAYTFAIRRLQGVLGAGEQARSGEAGVAVLMRYTLRLLTAQQSQRAAALVCAAEVERRADEATWGAEPFRIGLWVGGSVSPNWYQEAEDQIGEAREAGVGKHVNVLQTLTCPWCGTPLRGQHDLRAERETRRVLLFCPNGEGVDACPFSRRNSDEGLPILTVDEEIYRYAPSLVIATVDKLAMLPWRGYAGTLFGRVTRRCPRHGYRHDDLDAKTGCTSRHNAKGGLPAATSQPVTRLRPPDLIIQDELHLISGSLGTTVGLFEAAVDQLCTWTAPDGTRTGPKIVASTATTRRAREQVLGVFGRDLAIFPPQVTDVADTFFSRQVPVGPKHPGRRYLGVCAHGTRMKSAEIRLAEILLIAGQTAFDRNGEAADPYMTLVGYFNATRELAGMRRYLDDDVATRLRFNGRRRNMSDRIESPTGILAVQELTSRISSADISEVLRHLEIGFDQELDTTERRRAIRADNRAAYGASGRAKQRTTHEVTARSNDRARDGRVPVDVVLATSMLQVGVDVSRFGLMVVTGQPKNTAEYIQASSRVGRDPSRPGLVVTLYNWARPRDLAHFEDFEHYHATFYRQVEALSVTPFTRRAIDRGTAATFVAAVRHAAEEYSRNVDAHDVGLDDEPVRQVMARLLDRAGTVDRQRGRDYLEERLKTIRDHWNTLKTGQNRVGYEERTGGAQRTIGLLRKAGEGRWDLMTTGTSMRETENEVNLLVPGGGQIFEPEFNAPDWSFAAAGPGDTDENDDAAVGDELGDAMSGRSR